MNRFVSLLKAAVQSNAAYPGYETESFEDWQRRQGAPENSGYPGYETESFEDWQRKQRVAGAPTPVSPVETPAPVSPVETPTPVSPVETPVPAAQYYENLWQASEPTRRLPGWAGIGLLGYAAWKAINNDNNEPYQRAAIEAVKRPIDLMTYDTSLLRQ